MFILLSLLLAFIALGVCLYHRTSQLITLAVVGAIFAIATLVTQTTPILFGLYVIACGFIAIPSVRRRLFSKPTLAVFRKILPAMSQTEKEAIDAGMCDIGFITGRGKRAIADHFDISYELEHQIQGTGKEEYLAGIRHVLDKGTFSSTRQREMKGLGHAILTGEVLVGDNPFGVILSDDLCVNEDGEGVMAQMAELYKQFRCSIVAIMEVPEDQVHKYGVIAGECMKDGLYRVDAMIEKPSKEEAPSNLAIIGRYILTPDIFDILRKTKPDLAVIMETEIWPNLFRFCNKRNIPTRRSMSVLSNIE